MFIFQIKMTYFMGDDNMLEIFIILYLADNRFCGKNFIDERYNHASKEYIPVMLDVFPNGDYELIYFVVKELRYKVEKPISKEQRG